MLSPPSGTLTASSAVTGSEAITFMSGSATPGITMTGSSPGRHRSMLSSGAPSELLPKNRFAVFTENPSCGRPGSSRIDAAPGANLESSSDWASSDIETSSGGALSASASSGSSGASAAGGAASAVLAPLTHALDVAGSSLAGAAAAGGAGSGRTIMRGSPLRGRTDFGESAA